MSSETTRKVSEGWERINRNPLNITDKIIPRLRSDELHSKLFASTTSSEIPSRISVVLPPANSSNAPSIRTRPIDRRVTKATTESTTSNAASTTLVNSSSTHLGSKLAGDALVAVSVTFGVSPFLTVVDKAIVESTAGTKSILASAANSIKSMARNPIEYLTSPTFLLMWAVYGATYTTANAFKTLEEHATYSRDRSASTTNHSSNNKNAGMFKAAAFLGTTVVNSGASMLKDRAYARMFSGKTSNSASFPRASYALWIMRDLSVIGSSFLLPDLVSAKMVDYYRGEMDRERARSLCQLGLPVVAQFVAGPFQYLGLDVYNRNLSGMTTAKAIVDRSKHMSRGIAPVIAARIARIIPGYSIGGVANTKLRTTWREKLLERDVAAMMNSKTGNSASTVASGHKEYATRMVALLHSNNNGDKKRSS